MRIGSSNIGMESTRRYHSLTARRASVTILAGNAGLRMNPGAEDGTEKKSIMGEDAWQEFYGKDPYADKKKELKEKLNEMNSRSGVRKLSYVQGERDALSTVRDRCMQYLFGIFFGETKKWDFMELREITEKAHTSSITINPEMLQTITYRQETYMEEKEDTDFSAGGVVRTADGRTIEFNINVQMSRSFQAYYGEQFQRVERQLVDPLVINLEGNVAEVKDQTFFFDLDADGVEEEISMLGSGSGYLALDKNGDGIINDGSELFGTKSGNGFADLAAYDSDGNGWIDEDDEIWSKLLIWTKDENGEDRCYTLAEKNIGAICLANQETDFTLASKDNVPNGRIRKTGIFLYENGYAGTIQHVDLAVHEQGKEQGSGRFDAAG
ncbi:MAG: hypothetical protein OSJ53_04630 [Kineothrix sp.]|nr:hypothetical protein [Kineothrix sp.]